MHRRHFLTSLGLAGLSGCLRLENDGATPASTAGSGPTRSPTASPMVTAQNQDPTATGTPEPTATATAEPTETATAADAGPVSGTWSQFAVDAANTGYSAAEAGPGADATERWRFDSGNLVVSSPVIADGRVVFTGFRDGGTIWAVDASTGSAQWSQSLPGVDHIGAPAIDGDRVYVPTWNRGDHENKLFALNPAAGSYVWQYDLRGGAFGSPTVVGDTVYVGDGPVSDESNGHVVAVKTDDGTERWRREVEGIPLGTPAVADGTVYATSFTPSDFEAYPSDPDWSHPGFPPKRFFVFGQIDEEPQASVAEMDATGYVTALAADGSGERWRTELPDFVVTGPAVADDHVVVGCWDHSVYALSSADGSEQWSHPTDGPISSQPSVGNGTVYVGSWDGSLYAVSLADGRREWLFPFGSKVTSSPAVTDDGVYVSVDNNGVHGITPEGREVFRFQGPIGDFNASSPAIADGALVVCGDIAERSEGGESGGPFLLS